MNKKMNNKSCGNRLTALYKKSSSCEAYLREYLKYVNQLFYKIDHQAIAEAAECFLRARDNDSTIFFIGNGGSAATASHFAQDLGEVGRKTGTIAFRTLSLSDSVPSITALGNDYGYQRIFSGQLSNLFKKGDVLVAISASGNSPNIIEAVRLADKLQGVTIGLVGFDGGRLAGLCGHLIWIRTRKGEYGPVEDIHLIIDHMITSYLTNKINQVDGII